MAEREQIHLDIQLRFHQKNDLKDFEIAPNSRPLKILLGSGSPGTVHSYQTVHFQERLLSVFKKGSKTYIQRRMDLYNLFVVFVLCDLMIVFYMFSAVLLWLLRDGKSNDSFSLTGRLMCFHFFQLSKRNDTTTVISTVRATRSNSYFLEARGVLREPPLFESMAPESQNWLHVPLLGLSNLD